MKRLMIICVALACTTAGWAQRSKISSADNYLEDAKVSHDYKKAVQTINEVIANESTKNDADAWYKRGQIYFTIAVDTTQNDPNALHEAALSFDKVVEIKPSFDPAYLNPYLLSVMNQYFNAGLKTYNDKNYGGSYESFMRVINSYKKYGGISRFKIADAKDERDLGRQAARLVRLSKTYGARAAYMDSKDAEAQSLYEELIKSNAVPKAELADVFTGMLQSYKRSNQTEKFNTTLDQASRLFPDNETFKALQLNKAVSSGNADVAITELEKAVAAKPGDFKLLMALGELYSEAARKQLEDTTGATFSTPTTDLLTKAEQNFKASASLKAEPRISYQMGYINATRGNLIVKQMNDLGTSAEDNKKYEQLMEEQKGFYDAAVPHFEDASKQLESKGLDRLDNTDRALYVQTLKALRQTYGRLKMTDNEKATDLKIKSFK